MEATWSSTIRRPLYCSLPWSRVRVIQSCLGRRSTYQKVCSSQWSRPFLDLQIPRLCLFRGEDCKHGRACVRFFCYVDPGHSGLLRRLTHSSRGRWSFGASLPNCIWDTEPGSRAISVWIWWTRFVPFPKQVGYFWRVVEPCASAAPGRNIYRIPSLHTPAMSDNRVGWSVCARLGARVPFRVRVFRRIIDRCASWYQTRAAGWERWVHHAGCTDSNGSWCSKQHEPCGEGDGSEPCRCYRAKRRKIVKGD